MGCLVGQPYPFMETQQAEDEGVRCWQCQKQVAFHLAYYSRRFGYHFCGVQCLDNYVQDIERERIKREQQQPELCQQHTESFG